MDNRDRWNYRHMQRRKIASAQVSHDRRLAQAEHVMRIASQHRRTQLYLLAALWRAEIIKENGD